MAKDLSAGIPYDDLHEGEPVAGELDGEAIALVRVGSEVHAIGGTCTHYSGPLASGLVVGHTVRCPWHHACFDIRNGAAIGAPALNPIPCFEVKREGALVRIGGKVSPDVFTKKAMRADGGQPDSIVVIGAGPAGAACAEALRREGYSKTITLVGDELSGPVDRPNLSKDFLAGKAEEDWIPIRTADFYKEEGIDFRPNDRVSSIDTKARKVVLASGASLGYGALVLATGASPIRLPIDGANGAHVHVLRTLADSRAIIAASEGKKRAVVIGASFIGLEAAASLRARGLDVTIVGPETIPLARVLGDEVGAFVRRIHEEHGETFKLGRKPQKIGEGSVTLDDGEEIAADVIVMGVGVRPRTELAEAAGLKVDRGITVDAKFRTSDANVYAAGDVARFPYDGELVRIEHFAVAERQGRSVALAILDREQEIRNIPFFWSAHHDVQISYVGHAEKFDRVVIAGKLDARDATIAYFDGDRIRAIATINRDSDSLRAEKAFQEDDHAVLRALVIA